MNDIVYLDYTANTPVDIQVLDYFYETSKKFSGNPNSHHQLGREASAFMDETTMKIAGLLNVSPAEIIYTSSATESNNTAIKGIAYEYKEYGKHIISTPLEHSSVKSVLSFLQKEGYEVDIVKVDSNGQISVEDFKKKLRDDTIIVSVTAVDSELGVTQPVAKIKEILSDYPNCHLHVDATQAIGKIGFDVNGIDLVSLSPHKFYGLNGCGLLIKKKGVRLEPLLHGGTSTTKYRSGTPAVNLAASTYMALKLALENLDERNLAVSKLNNYLRTELLKFEKININSPQSAIPHILNLSVEGIKGTVFQRMLDEKGICVSVKSACSTDGMPSEAVMAISGDRRNALSSFRISLSHLTTMEELKSFMDIFGQLCPI